MNRRTFLLTSGISLGLGFPACLWAESAGDSRLRKWSVQVDGIQRDALISVPKPAWFNPSPVVFVFHGHGGSAHQAALSFDLAREWPQAICVYMQGLNTPGRLTDPEGRQTGWQQSLGEQNDRDLKFFDATLLQLQKEFNVDSKRIYSTGHSNGGAFTYLLWETRPEQFAAFAPSGAATPRAGQLKPKPAIHIAGQSDRLVRFEWQNRTMEMIRKNNGCALQGEEQGSFCIKYPSRSGTPFVAYIHPGGHEFPAQAPALMVRFFKENVLP